MKQRIERINWEEDVLNPEIEALKANKALAGLPDSVSFDIVVEDANPSPLSASGSREQPAPDAPTIADDPAS